MARRVVRAKPTSGKQLDGHALFLVRKYQPSVLSVPSPFDIERFFENDLEPLTGVQFDYRELRYNVMGYTDSDEMVSVVSTRLADDPSTIKLFRATVAHETAHAILHALQFRTRREFLKFVNSEDDAGLRMYREDQIPLYENPEWQAWRFAKGLLMPASTVTMAIEQAYTLEDMSAAFGVSTKFVRSRLKELGYQNLQAS